MNAQHIETIFDKCCAMQKAAAEIPEQHRYPNAVAAWESRGEQVLAEKVTDPDFQTWLFRWANDEEFRDNKLSKTIRELANTYLPGFGLFKDHAVDGVEYQQELRKEWERT